MPRGYTVIDGRAEPQDMQDFVAAARGATGDWESFSKAVIADALDRYKNERVASLNAGTFHHADHGAFFVQAVAGIIQHIAEPHKKCLYRLMSMDPISTFFIFLDPMRKDDALNNAVQSAVREVQYMTRDAAKQAYKEAFSAACASIGNRDELIKCIMKLKQPSGTSMDALKKHVDVFYAEVEKSPSFSGCDFYGCLSAGCRARLRTYDEFRYAMAIMLMNLYPCNDAFELVKANPGTADEERRLSALKSLVNAFLFSSSPPSDMVVIQDFRDHAECAHFICSDYFPFVPLCSSDCDRMMAPVDKVLGKEGIDSKNQPLTAVLKLLSRGALIPYCLSRHLCEIFDKVY